MKQSLGWRIGLTLCILISAAVFLAAGLLNTSAPGTTSEKREPVLLQRLLPGMSINLGLDLRGGIHLTLGVEVEKALQTALAQMGQDLMSDANAKGILMTRPRAVPGDRLEFTLASPGKKADLDEMLAKTFAQLHEVSATPLGDGKYRYVVELTADARTQLSDMTVEQALTTIRNRIDQFGVAEPDVRKQQGEDRITIQLPGMDDPQRAVEIIGKTAHLEFRMVRDDVSPSTRPLPLGSEVLPMENGEKGSDRSAGSIVVESQVAMTGEHITNAAARYDQDGSSYVGISFDRRGTELFGRITRENVGRRMAIVLDGKVHSAPVIRQEIMGDASITGGFTPTQASDLALVLRAGSLPAPVKVLEERTVGPSLGQESIDMGMRAVILGGIMVMLFMAVYYGRSGIIADAMLFLDVVLILAGMAVFGATLTLPGIAGIVLTLGMAVDANVLIFERIREELAKGLTPRAAVETGFSKAMLAITDSNLTTIIAALILYQFGTGPIRGFAVTLTLGILASMFTAIFVSRIIFDLWMAKPGRKLSI